jgi:hypothetical protein
MWGNCYWIDKSIHLDQLLLHERYAQPGRNTWHPPVFRRRYIWDNTMQHLSSLRSLVYSKHDVLSSVRRRTWTQDCRLYVTYLLQSLEQTCRYYLYSLSFLYLTRISWMSSTSMITISFYRNTWRQWDDLYSIQSILFFNFLFSCNVILFSKPNIGTEKFLMYYGVQMMLQIMIKLTAAVKSGWYVQVLWRSDLC